MVRGIGTGSNTIKWSILAAFTILIFVQTSTPAKHNVDFITKITDAKHFKKFVRTHTNVLTIFSKTAKDFTTYDIFNEAAENVKGTGSIVHIDCSVDKKMCKKLKSSPSPLEYKHFKDSEYHKNYDRKLTVKSIIKFLQNPTGETPWDEEADALDVVHVEKKPELFKLISKEKKPILVMFYAPWCGFCKKLKPDFAAAATALKNEAVLVGMDADTVEGTSVRIEFNITGFPTLIYFKDGLKEFDYGGEHSKDGIISWMRDPQPPKPPEVEQEWSEVESDIVHLTEDSFDDVIKEHLSVLVMFYAPWCGHCKKMKPEYQETAAVLKQEGVPSILAAVDATKNTKLAERFSIKGYPTVKYFKDGKEQFDINERTKDSILEFLKDPKQPPPPAPTDLPWGDTPSHVENLNEETFKNIKKKKHCLVIFYAPWCGHCKKAKPEFMSAAEELKDDSRVAFAAVDCTKSVQLCQSNGVTGYPTFKYFNYGKNEQKYSGGREKHDFINFIQDPFGTPVSKEQSKLLPLHWNDVPGHEVITILKNDNFDDFIQQHDIVIVTFYGAACSHCHAMRKDFVDAATALKEEMINASFAVVDSIAEQPLNNKYGIIGLPTIKVFKNGKQHLEYEGERTKADFINLVKHLPPEATPFTDYESNQIVHIHSFEQFDDLISTNDRLVVFFYDASNPKSSQTRPAFWSAAENAPVDVANKFQLAVLDCASHHDICKKNAISVYPTFKLYIDRKYDSDFDHNTPVTQENLLAFLFRAPSTKMKKEAIKIEL